MATRPKCTRCKDLPASGIWHVVGPFGKIEIRWLCAKCAFTLVHHWMGFDVDLINSYITHAKHPAGEGAKHWVGDEDAVAESHRRAFTYQGHDLRNAILRSHHQPSSATPPRFLSELRGSHNPNSNPE